jgi:hypothetical protein
MPPLAAVPNLERELDELYGLPLEDWTRARNDLANRLKKAHQDEHAEEVRRLRKPSVVAWAVNQLARRKEHAVAALLRAGEQLRKAQEDALRGRAGAADVSTAARAEREAVRDLVTAARELLDEAGHAASQATLDRVSQTLRAAAVDETARELLERGRFEEELRGVGFGSLAAVQPAPRPRTDELRAAREHAKELRAEARRLAKEARDAEAEAERLEHEAARAREEAEAKRVEAERAATELAEAEAALERRRR